MESKHFGTLERAVRESADLEQRIAECQLRISRMCSEGRPPRMSIPVNWNDDDIFIATTLKDCAALRAEVERLKAMYEAPLTDEEAQAAWDASVPSCRACEIASIDAAIREVRKGRKDADSL